MGAIDLNADLLANPVVWEFPGVPRGRILQDEELFPGLLEEADARGFYGTPVAIGAGADEFVIADHDAGTVFAVRRDGTSARVLLETEDRVIAGIVVGEDARTVFVATTDDHVYAIDSDNPPADRDDLDRFLWVAEGLGGKVWGTPALAQTTAHGSILIVPTTGGRVVALRVADGTVAWTFKSEAAVVSDIVVRDGSAYFGGFDRTFYALDVEMETGDPPKWTQSGDDWFWTTPLIVDNALYVGDLSGKIWAWDIGTGAPIWLEPYDTTERIRARPAVTEAGELVIITREGTVLALDAASGLKIWPQALVQLQTDNRVLADPLILDDGSILISDDQGLLWRSRVNRGAVCQVFPDRNGTCELLLDGDQG